ncbi:hypothetical protein BGZ83_009482 [Gryganskiella cystojenkinii]|nr:hypothetical protein BGZ83_009482 [Gryganskiella cystojenkinii]
MTYQSSSVSSSSSLPVTSGPPSQMTSPGSQAAAATIHMHGLRYEALEHHLNSSGANSCQQGNGSPSAQQLSALQSLRSSASPSGSSPSSINVSLSGGINNTPALSVANHHQQQHFHQQQHHLSSNNNNNPNHPSNGLPPINTDILTNYHHHHHSSSSSSSMLASPIQSTSQLSSNNTTAGSTSVLPTTPPLTADLDAILAMYAGQPELLKMIIASKTEEDRRRAEEARFKMMDLMMRGENHGMALLTGYDGVLNSNGTPTTHGAEAGTGAGATTGTSAVTAAAITPSITATTACSPTNGISTVVGSNQSNTSGVGGSSVLLTSMGLNSSAKRYMEDDDEGLDQRTPGTAGSGVSAGSAGATPNGGGSSSSTVGPNAATGQGDHHPGLSRKRSVTFAREVHGHLRSQSMSSMPSGSNGVSMQQLSGLSMMPLTEGPHHGLAAPLPPSTMDDHSQYQQLQHHPIFQSTPGLTLAQQYQQQQQQHQLQSQHQHQFPQQQQLHNLPQMQTQPLLPPLHQQLQQQQPHQQLPPQFGQYPQQMFSYHGAVPGLQHHQQQQQQQIRRTSSLSHLNQFTQNPHMIGTTEQQQRLVAGRPRNFSASSHRPFDDSDEESDDEDYSDHPVMGQIYANSRPGSSLGMNNTLGGTQEVSITHEFSDMLSGSSGLSGSNGPSQGHVHGHGHSHSHGGGPFGHQHHQAFQPHHSQHHPQHQPGSSNMLSQSSSSTANNSMAILSTLHAGLGTVVSSNVFNPSISPNVTLVRSASAGRVPSSVSTVVSSSVSSADAAAADQKKKRKRREMQPVNEIFETEELPHVDHFLWKNNGNTIQKKTKCKSIYYKCSNSGGGCTVNKTVTEKEGGGYITKYRGLHLPDCSKLKRAQMAVQAAQAAQNAYSLEKEQ